MFHKEIYIPQTKNEHSTNEVFPIDKLIPDLLLLIMQNLNYEEAMYLTLCLVSKYFNKPNNDGVKINEEKINFAKQNYPTFFRFCMKIKPGIISPHFCYLPKKGIFSWGVNKYGQLGWENHSLLPSEPVKVPAKLAIKKIAGSSLYTLFLTADNQIYGCGRNPFGAVGRENYTTPEKFPDCLQEKIIDVIARGPVALLLSANNHVYILGGNRIQVISFEKGNFTSIAAGNQHTYTLLLTDDKRVYGFEKNYLLDLFNNNCAEVNLSLIPFPPKVKISKIDAGYWLSLFLTTDGDVYVSGMDCLNSLNKLKKLPNALSTPQLLHFPESKIIIKISAGTTHALFLTKDRKVYGVGSNVCNQLGIQNELTTDFTENPIPINLPNDIQIEDIVAGPGYSLFLTNTNKIYGCGHNDQDCFGIGEDDQAEPIEIFSPDGIEEKQDILFNPHNSM